MLLTKAYINLHGSRFEKSLHYDLTSVCKKMILVLSAWFYRDRLIDFLGGLVIIGY